MKSTIRLHEVTLIELFMVDGNSHAFLKITGEKVSHLSNEANTKIDNAI